MRSDDIHQVKPRVADSSDLIELLALYEQWIHEQRQYRGKWEEHEGLTPSVDEALRDAMRSPRSCLFVMDVKSMLGGAALGDLIDLSGREEERVICRIRWLFVARGMRQLGIGHSLYEAIQEWAHNQGAAGIEMGVLPGHRVAKNFCEGHGLKARLLIMAEHWY